MNASRVALGALLCSVLGSSGCISLLGPEDLRFRLSLQNGVGIDRVFAVGADGLTLRTAAAFAPMDLDIGLQHVHWADFGTFTLRDPANGMVSNAKLPGYESIVRVRERGEEVNVLVKQNEHSIKSLVVLVREGDELTVARVRGRIEKMLPELMESDMLGIDLGEILQDSISTKPEAPPGTVATTLPED